MQANLKSQACDLSLTGLEQRLDSQNEAPLNCSDLQDWTIDETAKALGISRGGVIRRLEDGILTGYRLKRGKNTVWRVKPVWLKNAERDPLPAIPPSELADSNSESSSGYSSFVDIAEDAEPQSDSPPAAQKDSDLIEIWQTAEAIDASSDIPSSTLRELIELKTRLTTTETQLENASSKLENANYKIGYLEARLEASHEQLKLISVLHRPWWHRMFHWK